MNYQAPQPQWNDNNGSTVTHYYKIQYDVQEKCYGCFYTNRITGDSSVKYAANGETIDDLKQWVETTHYPSALIKAGFKPVRDTLALIKQWGDDRNLIKGSTPQAQFVKLIEETGELASGIAKGQLGKIEDSIGDVIVVLVMIASQFNLNVEDCIAYAYNEIKDRKGRMIDGVFVKESDLQEFI